jgi:rubrerythrin
MNEDGALKILKDAILLERRGQAFYQTVADGCAQPAVKEFFEKMAAEEKRHVAVLSEQFRSYKADSKFTTIPNESMGGDETAMQVLSDQVRDRIAAADFEAAAISAAMLMEERAIKLYSERAAASTDENEKAIYEWLSEWEQGHLRLLSSMDQDLKEEIWNDNNFWPF